MDLEKLKSKKFNLLIIGPPASGKGTEAELLAKDFNMRIISAGDLIRDKIKSPTPEGQEIKKYYDRGELIPERFTDQLILNDLKKTPQIPFILDGFPRNDVQINNLEKFLKMLNYFMPIALHLKISDETVLKRITTRRICEKCANISLPGAKGYKEGKCPKCGGKLIQRPDDNSKSVKKRLEVYHSQTQPLLDYFQKLGKLVEVDGEPSIPEVYQIILERLNDYFEKSPTNRND